MRLLKRSIVVLILILLQSSCFTPAQNEQASKQEEHVLTVYLNDYDDIIGPMFEDATGIKINLVQGSGTEILSRIEAERGNPRWDVVWVDMISSVHGLGLKGMLYEDYVPEHTDQLKDTFKALIPDKNWYFPTGAHAAAVIVYHNEVLTAEQAPQSWSDFSNPLFKNAIGVADPAIAAPAYPFVNWFFYEQGLDNGKAMISSWFNNGLYIYPKNPNVAMALIAKQIHIAALQENNAYLLLNQQQPVSVIWPNEGAPASVRVAAISKETKQLKAAKAFINFLLDPAIQQAIIDQSEEAYHEPSAVGVQEKANRHPHARLLFTDTDWSYKHEAEIKQWFADFSIK